MKLTTICVIVALACSCRHTKDDTHAGSTEDAMARHDEIRKIMRSYWIHKYESGGFNSSLWSAVERKKIIPELRKMKEDYHYEFTDPNIPVSVPGQGWTIRGPLTIAQIEQKSLEEIRKYPEVPQLPFGYENDKWDELKIQYKDGDEFYFFASDQVSLAYFHWTAGYVLVRDNHIVGLKVTSTS